MAAKTKDKSKCEVLSTKTEDTLSCEESQPEVLHKSYVPSHKEVENGKKVLAILEKIEDIGYTVHRPDLFTVEEPGFGLHITIDTEEEVICLVSEVCSVEHLENNVKNWQEQLLKLNNALLHGKFCVHKGKVLLRENLAAKNLDPNELEDALSSMFAGLIRYARALKLL